VDLKQFEKYWKPIEKYMVMRPVLALIAEGLVFRKLYGIILKILAALTGIGGLYFWIRVWIALFSWNSAGFIISGIFFELVFIGLMYAVIHILLIRAQDIEKLPETGYTIIPIMSISFKLLGEIYACLFAFIGICGSIFIWIAGASITELFPISNFMPMAIPGEIGFWGGLISLISGIMGAFGILVLFYFLAELIIVLVDIATSLKHKK
jgi:hypothetical protein